MGRYSVVGVATHYRMEGSGFETLWERDFPHPSRQTHTPNKLSLPYVSGLLLGGCIREDVAFTTHPHKAHAVASYAETFTFTSVDSETSR